LGNADSNHHETSCHPMAHSIPVSDRRSPHGTSLSLLLVALILPTDHHCLRARMPKVMGKTYPVAIRQNAVAPNSDITKFRSSKGSAIEPLLAITLAPLSRARPNLEIVCQFKTFKRIILNFTVRWLRDVIKTAQTRSETDVVSPVADRPVLSPSADSPSADSPLATSNQKLQS
jgi:hypothetical protein